MFPAVSWDNAASPGWRAEASIPAKLILEEDEDQLRSSAGIRSTQGLCICICFQAFFTGVGQAVLLIPWWWVREWLAVDSSSLCSSKSH